VIARYRFHRNQTLEFSQAVIDTFLKYRQSPGMDEAGGILLGNVYTTSHTIVEAATTPGSLDRAGPYYFERSRAAAQAVVNSSWRESGGVLIYLGEWHTHLAASPTPSRRDRAMIRNMLRQTEMAIDCLVLVVVGTENAWVGIDDGRRLAKLSPCYDQPSSCPACF
jgi:integrative and conjugative element protein (TIGR02256 family)